MRIIAGSLGGRQFEAPHGHRTHPMSAKMRGALFNALGDLNGLSLLDAFAGSGALAFEAVSRGAARAMVIDNDSSAQRILAENIASLDLSGRVKLIRASVEAWLRTSEEKFDVVISDPPYEKPQLQLLAKLAARAKPGGVVVFSLPPETNVALPDDYTPLSTKDYGDGQLIFYRAPED